MEKMFKRSISMLLGLCMVLSILAMPGVMVAKAEGEEETPATDYLYYNDMSASADGTTVGLQTTTKTAYAPYGFNKGGAYARSSGVKEGEYFRIGFSGDDRETNYYSITRQFTDAANGTYVLSYKLRVNNTESAVAAYRLEIPTLADGKSNRTVNIAVIEGDKLVYGSDAESPLQLKANEWQDITIVYDGAKAIVFVDGVEWYRQGLAGKNIQYINSILRLPEATAEERAGLGFDIDEMYVYNFVAAESFTAAAESYAVAVGGTVATAWNKVPADAYVGTVTYASSDEAVATVDANGVVTGVAEGIATITATPDAMSGLAAAETTVVVGNGGYEAMYTEAFYYNDMSASADGETVGLQITTKTAYAPYGFQKGGSYARGSGVQEGEYFRMAFNGDSRETTYHQIFRQFTDVPTGAVAMSYKLRVNNADSAVTAYKLEIPSFGADKGGRSIGIYVKEGDVLCYGENEMQLKANEWQDILIVATGTKAYIYVDGALFCAHTYSEPIENISYVNAILRLPEATDEERAGLGFDFDELKIYTHAADAALVPGAAQYEVAVGATVTTGWAKTPDAAYFAGITFTSSNDAIATVNERGVVTGVADGAVTITANAYGIPAATTVVIVGAGCGENHDYKAVVTAPTCAEAGYTTYTCACGETYVGDEVAATGEHNYVDGVCDVCGAVEEIVPAIDENLTIVGKDMLLGGYIGAQFTVNPEATGAYDSVYIVVVFDGQEFTYNVPLFEGAHVFEHRVAPKYMGEALKITAYGVKGEEVIPGVTVEWSIKDGIMERLAKFYPYIKHAQYKNRCILLVDMLYYGAAAQTTFGTDTNGLVTDGLSADYAALKTATEPTIEKTNTATSTKTNQLYQYNLGVEDAVQMQFTFRLTTTDYSGYVAKITLNGTTYEYTGEDFIPMGDSDTLKKFVTVVFDKLEAVNMRDEVTIELWQNGAKVSNTYTASIEGFATASIAVDKNVELLKAMIAYGDSAKVSLG